jgi:hypothetical protein
MRVFIPRGVQTHTCLIINIYGAQVQALSALCYVPRNLCESKSLMPVVRASIALLWVSSSSVNRSSVSLRLKGHVIVIDNQQPAGLTPNTSATHTLRSCSAAWGFWNHHPVRLHVYVSWYFYWLLLPPSCNGGLLWRTELLELLRWTSEGDTIILPDWGKTLELSNLHKCIIIMWLHAKTDQLSWIFISIHGHCTDRSKYVFYAPWGSVRILACILPH